MNSFSPIKLAGIIDDDEIHAFIIQTLISACAFAEEAIVFSNGKEALDYFNHNRHMPEHLPDVLFLDIEMPVMDAWSFLEHFDRLKEKPGKPLHIYMLTNSIYKNDQKKAALFDDVSGYLLKPLTKEALQWVLEDIEGK